MIIQHNMQAMNSNRMLGSIVTSQAKSTEKLASGFRINRAADDAAGLSISEKMRGQIRGLEQASTNAQDGISLIQTAEGALNESHAILQRMRELSVQAANGTATDDDRNAVQAEVAELQEELTRIAETTEFNTMKLLDGSFATQAKGVASGSTLTGTTDPFTATSAKVVSGAAVNNTAALGADATKVDTITIDGAAIALNWDELLSDTTKVAIKTGQNGATFAGELAAEMEAAINKQIDDHNATTGSGVAHISLEVDTATGKMVLTSGTTGTQSSIKVTAGDDTSLMYTLQLNTDGGTAQPADKTQQKGTYILNEALTGSGMSLSVNGQKIYVTAMDKTKAAANQDVNAVRAGVTVTDIAGGTKDTNADGNTDVTLVAGAATDSVIEELQARLRHAVADSMKAQGLGAGDEGYVDANSINVSFKQGAIVIEGPEGVELGLAGKDAEILGIATESEEAKTGKAMTLQIGANESQTMNFNIEDMSAKALGVDGDNVDISTQDAAKVAMTTIDEAIKKVSAQRSQLGAVQNRLEHTISNLDTSAENLQAAESRIRDTDMAKEMTTYSKNNILQQAAQSMLSQANQSTQGVLSLLQ